MMFSAVGCSLRCFIASKSRTKNSYPAFQPPGRELTPDPFKIDKLSNKHRFHPFLLSLNQTQSLKRKDPTKKFGRKHF